MEQQLTYKGSLKNLKVEAKLIKVISDEIRSIFPDLNKIKLNVDLINQICNLIESNVKQKNLKVNKLELFFKVYESLFGNLDARDKAFITNMIDYLHNNDLIQARSFMSRVYRFVKRVVKKKVQ